jgi:gliding motility-associated-like protein
MVYPGQDPDAELQLFGDVPACPGVRLLLVGSGGGTYAWLRDSVLLPGATDSTLFVTVGGDYYLIVETGCGADTSQAIAVTYGNGPTAGLQWYNYPLSLVQFRDQSISASQWLWIFGDGSGASTLQNPEHQYPNPGEYAVTLIVHDIYGCADTLSMIVSVTDPDFFIPNVFSPNADGINDVAMTNFKKLLDFEFSIYDRWGHKIWQTDVQDTWWDGNIGGNAAPDGVYYYYLKGSLPQEREAEQRGPLTLMR